MEDQKVKGQVLELPAEVNAQISAGMLSFKGPKGEGKLAAAVPGIKISVEGKKITFESLKPGKKVKKMLGTLVARSKNMVEGVTNLHTYKMKICSGHFPMTVTVSGHDLIIKNFFGEKFPRKLKINPEVKVKVEGQEIIIDSIDIDAASQFAGSVEQITRRSNFDRRIFMDGIYIISKGRHKI